MSFITLTNGLAAPKLQWAAPGGGGVRRIAVMAAVLGVTVGATGCAVAVPGAASAASGPVTAAPFAAPSADPTAAAQAPPPRSRGALYRDPKGRFELNPPPHWGIDDTGRLGPAVVFFDPAQNPETTEGSGAFITVFVAPASSDWPSLVTQYRQELSLVPDFQSIADEPISLSNGSAAHMFGFTARTSEETERTIQVLAVNDDSELVVVTCRTLPRDWDVYGEMFVATLNSLVVTT